VLTPSEERRRLYHGPIDDEAPEVGTVAMGARCAGDASRVLDRCRAVMAVVLRYQGEDWPSREQWREVLPEWFVAACSQELSAEEAEEWLARWQRLPASEQEAMSRREPWALADWLHWLRPDERQWFWWDATVVDDDWLRVVVEVAGWPAPLGALRWLLTAAGALDVVEEQAASP
jgi:hypothetical protein